MKTVELRHAYEWTCDECGRDNYSRGIKPSLEELDDDEREMLDDGEWMMQPMEVTCPHCGTTFKVEHDEECQ